MSKIKFQENKEWYKSKTFWFNTFLLTSGIINAIIGEYQITGVITVPAVINIILRYFTKKGLL